MDSLLFVIGLTVAIFSLPAYIFYSSQKSESNSLFWQLYFSDTQPRLLLTIITFPVIALLSIYELVLSFLDKSKFNLSVLVSALLSITWVTLLVLALIS